MRAWFCDCYGREIINYIIVRKAVDLRGLNMPQDKTWTDFDGPLWIQYNLFLQNKNRGPKR